MMDHDDFFGGGMGGGMGGFSQMSSSGFGVSMGGGGSSQSMSTKTYMQDGKRVTRTEKTTVINGQRTTEVTE